VFAFNGGPGSSSVWLHLGAFGPRRVELDDDGLAGPPPGRLVPNADSILDVADLVFIDPVGTGYSRAIPHEEQKKYAHFKRDIESVGEFIRLYLSRNGRWASPKYVAGESYGTTRAGGLAGHMLDRHGLYLNGVILVSAVLNFLTGPFDPKTLTFTVGNDVPYLTFLPTYAAAAWYHGRIGERLRERTLREVLTEVEEWARTDYAVALVAGDSLPDDRAREVAERLAEYTGLSVDYLVRYRNRIEILRFCKELLRDDGRTIGRLDARYTGTDRFVGSDAIESDPSGDAITGRYAALLNDYVRRELGYETDLPYEVLSTEVFQAWDYEDFKNAFVDTSETLRAAMTRNRYLHAYVANGYYDLATPHAATEYTFDHMGLDPEARERVTMSYFEAGHMMYVHRPSRERLASELRAFVRETAG
jgi:carboxypeptidase C (cathepsin A)